MQRIPCPWCGHRPESEFDCGGQTGIARPPLDCDDATFGRYLFVRDNPRGLHDERWRHTYGCGMWFNLRRDTVTHAVVAAWRYGGQPEDGAP